MNILPSLLASNPLYIKQDIEKMLALGMDSFHIDIMDYRFTPNFGLSVSHCRAILKAFPTINLDVHLMMDPTPLTIIEDLINIGVTDISLHPHTMSAIDFNRLLSNSNLKIRAALLPDDKLDAFLQYPRLLFLAVSPGFCGQTMQKDVLFKLKQAKTQGIDTMLDGGINLDTAEQVLASNPDAVVVGGGLINQRHQDQLKFLNMLRGPQD